MSERYVLILGELVQDTAMNVGGNAGSGRLVDMPFCRDGRGRLTLRGDGLAGALVATARRLGYSAKQLSAITGEKDKAQGSVRRHTPSAWRVLTTHPRVDQTQEYKRCHASPGLVLTTHPRVDQTQARQQVSIDPRTGADVDKSLRDLETTPRKTCWPFGLEVDLRVDPEAAGIAWAALKEWEQKRCWLGRGVASGTGWLHLEGLTLYRLNGEDRWPNSRASADPLGYIRKAFATRRADAVEPPVPQQAPPCYTEIRGVLHVGPRPEEKPGEASYGLDGLSIGGHTDDQLTARFDPCHFIRPRGVSASWRAEEHLDTDFPLVMAPDPAGLEPVIPGASLRGALRHACLRYWRLKGLPEDDIKRRLTALFGDEVQTDIDTRHASALLVADANLAPDCDWQAVCLHHHAEDEFTAGVFETGKFDRTVLLQGTFDWRLVIEHPADPSRNALVKAALEDLRTLLKQGEKGFLPVGGGRWRGAGWPRWEVPS